MIPAVDLPPLSAPAPAVTVLADDLARLAAELRAEPTALQVDTYRTVIGLGLPHHYGVYAALVVPMRAAQAEVRTVGFFPPDPWSYR